MNKFVGEYGILYIPLTPIIVIFCLAYKLSQT